MLSKKEIEITGIREELNEIQCDLCQKKLLAKKEDDDELAVAHLMFFRGEVGDAKQNGTSEAPECETSDFCEDCYIKIKKFLTKLGAKIPSYYVSESEPEFEDAFFEIFLPSDDEEDEEQEEDEE